MRNPFDAIEETDESWLYADAQTLVDFDSHDVENPYDDIDLLELKADPRVFELLSENEYSILNRRFGLNTNSESMKDIAHDLGITHTQAREILGSALAKVKEKLLSEVD
jgi:DNA-directed RNA polymerase sigma subunit (sigma70/sigma32)